jgi:hypothetical protein
MYVFFSEPQSSSKVGIWIGALGLEFFAHSCPVLQAQGEMRHLPGWTAGTDWHATFKEGSEYQPVSVCRSFA